MSTADPPHPAEATDIALDLDTPSPGHADILGP